MTLYFSSDHHFNHEKVIEYSDRPYDSLEEMHNELIINWNSVVDEDDTVFVVGDFSMREGVSSNELLSRLNGNKVMISGNHDPDIPLKACYLELFNKGFEVVHNPIDSSSHYTIHGHVHVKEGEKMVRQKNGRVFINVNVELWGYTPVSEQQIKQLLVDNKIIKG